eukprot:5427881-Pyramimonas_sp.AAC.1
MLLRLLPPCHLARPPALLDLRIGRPIEHNRCCERFHCRSCLLASATSKSPRPNQKLPGVTWFVPGFYPDFIR